jgi:DNA-binding transcriptional LysR family regulator
MTLSTRALQEFATLARRLNFARAAEELKLHPSVLSRRIRALEEELDARLLERDTKRVTLTESGQLLLHHALEVLARLGEAEAAVTARHSAPTGLLRLAVPNLFGQLQIAPLIPKFMQRHPQLKIEMTFTDRFLDLAETGHDAAVRIGARAVGGNLRFRRLAPNRRVLCASPEYLAARGAPCVPSDLTSHRVLHFTPLLGGACWQLNGPEGPFEIALEPVLAADNIEALRLGALGGVGIAMLATFVAGADLRAGRLVVVLPQYSLAESEVAIVYKDAPLVPVRVRALVDFLVEAFSGTPLWEAAPEAGKVPAPGT